MADRIKGITVEIDGNTTGLSKALSGVNREIGSTQSQLKDVERLLKLDPTNTQLLEQKQRLLGDAVEGTRTKLSALKEAEAKAQQQFAEGKISQQQYEGLQREIIDTENRLRDLETQAAKSNATLAGIQATADRIHASAANVARATAPLTAGILGAGAAAIKAMDNVDEGLDTVMKKTGATGAAAKELQDVYNNIAKTVPGDFGDIGAAVGEVNTRLEFTGEALERASTDFLKFAKINDSDVNSAVQLVTRAMGDAGIAAEEYGLVLDSLTVAGQKSGISVDKLAENLAKYGAPLRALGVDTQEAIAMFAGWEKAGVNTEIAFSGMKKAISNWGAAGKDASEEFGKTMQAIKEAPDIAGATALAIEAFGAKAGPDLADAIRGGRFEVDEYIAALQNAGGAVDATYGMIVDEVDDAQLAMQTLQVAAHDVGETLAKSLGPALLGIAQKVESVFTWFGNLDSGAQGVILTVIGLIAAISPVAGLIAGISSIVGVVTAAIGTLTGGIALFTGAATTGSAASTALAGALSFLAANPIVLVIAAIAALVLALTQLWQHNEAFRTAVLEIWSSIQLAMQTFQLWLDGIFATDWTLRFGTFGNVINSFFANVKNVWDGIKLAMTGVMEFIKGVFTGDWQLAWQGVQDIFKGIFDALEGIAKAPINGIISLLNMAIDAINFFIRGLNRAISLMRALGVNIPMIPELGHIAYLAKGGILAAGSAIVGERGPELLSMIGGKAQVTPLTGGTRDRVAPVSGGEYTQTLNFYGDQAGSPAEIARQTRRATRQLVKQAVKA